MTHRSRSWRSASSALLPVATAALAIGIFIADTVMVPEISVAVLYVAVVLMAARFCRPPGVVLVGAGCIGLTGLSYFLSADSALNAAISIAALGSTTFSIAAIGLAAFLTLQNQSAEAKLREQANLLDLTHDSIVARRFDDDLITYWSRGAEELYGWQRAEAVGRVGSEFRKNVAPLPFEEIKAELLRVGRWEGELVNNRRDGTPVLVASRWSLQRDRHGRPATIVVTSNDITERKRAEQALRESEEQWREVFEHNPVMYFMVSPTGKVLSVNGFGASQLGYTVAELVGQSVLSVFFEEDRALVKDQLATCVEELGRPNNWEIRKICKDGTVLWVRENAKAVQRPGDGAIILIACEDITERRRAEQRRDALYAVTRVLAEADSLADAASHLLQAIGENLEWDWGALWSIHREATPLRCDCLWHAPDFATAEFDTVARERTFVAGEGRLGQVWRTANPIWMFDATAEPEFLRASAAANTGLHGGVIFPILLDTEPLGIVEFFCREVRERDEEQLATLSAIGSQIGQFIKRQRAEAAVRASEERWRRLFETSAAGMALNRLDGVFTAANPALQRMLGRAEEEIVGHNVLELNHEDERAATAEAYARYRSGSLTERHMEKKYLRTDGSPVWLNITTTLVPGTETAAPFLQSVYMDITERVQFEAALRASEARWRAVFENTAVGIVTSDLHGRYETANEAFQRMTGYSWDELRKFTVLDVTPEEDWPATQKRIDEIIAGPRRSYRVERRYQRKDGEFVWADINTFFIPATDSTPAFLAVVAVDITERKQAEEALREAEERFRALVQFSFDVYWESDAQHRFTRQEFGEGVADAPPPGSEISKTRWEVPYLEPDAEAWRKHRETLDAHLPFRDFEHARPTPDGGKRYVSVSGLPVFDKAGRFIGYRGVGRHITDRKRAEAALRASEERWRCMFEIASVGIATTDFESRRYLTVNESFQRMTGYTEAELRNLTTLELTHEDDRAAMQERIDSGTVGRLQRKRYRRKDGEIVWADVTSFVVPATDSTPAFRGAVVVDITDRKRAEAALQQAQADLARLNRVMLLGEMTASIAHEVNQPIAATVTNAHAGLRWLSARPPDLEEAKQALGRIVRDGSRAGEVIDRIRALVKKVPPRRELLDINEAIREIIALTQTEVQQNRVRLQTRLADDLPLVPADRVQLQQVIMNLLVNAVEAMSSVDHRPRELTLASGEADTDAVFVEVQDTGPGIDPADLDRLFQSFYTTKPDGIGMGLAISRSIVEAHGGRLSAAPHQPHGAVFRFTVLTEEKSPESAPSHRVDMMRSIGVRQEGG
jgi:PAS domain S-box-containing protein